MENLQEIKKEISAKQKFSGINETLQPRLDSIVIKI